MKIGAIAVKIFSPIAEKYENLFLTLKEDLPKADIRIPFKTYVSLVFLITTISAIFSFASTVVVFEIFERPLMETLSYAFLVSILISFTEFILFVLYPSQKVRKRKINIETNLPFVISHMGALAESGIPPYVMFKLISEFEEYGELSKEMKKIVRNIDTFGLDPMSAIKEVAERTPSEQFKQLLIGFISTTESGGSLKIYLKEVGEQIMFEWKNKREKFIRILDMFAEIYTGIIVAAPLFLVAILAVMGMIEPNIGGWSIIDLMKLGTYLGMPLINIMFIAFLHMIEVEI